MMLCGTPGNLRINTNPERTWIVAHGESHLDAIIARRSNQ